MGLDYGSFNYMHVTVITVQIALQRIFPPRGCGGPEKDQDLFLAG